MSITLQFDLPDSLVEEARTHGLLESRRIAELLSEELQRQRARQACQTMLSELHALPGKPMTQAEVLAEIDAARAERRRLESCS